MLTHKLGASAAGGCAAGCRNWPVRLLALVFVIFVAATAATAQTFSLLYSFSGSQSGLTPYGSLTLGTVGYSTPIVEYGTTLSGGDTGYGTVYRITAEGTESVIHSFLGGALDGATPSGNLARDKAGNFYGTTQSGGACEQYTGNCGTVFKIDASGRESLLYSFQPGTSDGQNPGSGVVLDSAGNLYGPAQGGQFQQGVIFKIDKATAQESIFYQFGAIPGDGINPFGSLTFDSEGNMYGVAQYGGSCSSGGGTLFKITPSGVESTLHSFCVGDVNGATPNGPVALAAAGNIYGVTQQGGDLSCPDSFAPGIGCGTVFEETAAGQYSVVHAFAGSPSDGAGDPGVGAGGGLGVVSDAAGNIYGITQFGGGGTGLGDGVVFEVAEGRTYEVLHTFQGGTTDGSAPQAPLLFLSGNLFGTTIQGGASNEGTIFRVKLK
jgi:uncharacterized repeat protein (TIGR03803 family)